jgi:hypothetical protein
MAGLDARQRNVLALKLLFIKLILKRTACFLSIDLVFLFFNSETPCPLWNIYPERL